MKNKIKKIIPYKIFDIYYYSSAILSALIYSFPSKKMIVIGVTGTKGKTSTINFIWSCLTAGGYKTGIISTANIRIGETESMNKYHMTMPGRFVIQSLMSNMAKQGCRFCIIETTSEGIKQHRNIGISYDILVFTNLFPEHLPSHDNSFEKYKQTKGIIFKDLISSFRKIVAGDEVKKVIITNSDSDHAEYYSSFKSDEKISFSINKNSDYKAENISNTKTGVKFDVNGEEYETKILGKFNIYNALPAIAISKLFNIDKTDIRKGLKHLELIPGRMEIINEGQDFTVVVDYAHEKESMTNLLQTAVSIRKPGSKIIVLLGAEGGGRDKAKRPLMGEISAKLADYVIVANVDPYEDDPKEIIEDIAVVAEKFGKIRNKDLFTIEDRKTAIEKAFELAKTDDIVLITGKGAEQSMIIDGKSIPWDDRKVVRSILIANKK
jgi:UDP-N-acetylmuramoyl-L-alanyl-D-glutamate--2,6-diaminopimelate ligase